MEPPTDSAERDDGLIVVECPLHGLFHFGPKVDLTAGPAQERTQISDCFDRSEL